MGGLGSGGYGRSRTRGYVEEYPRININELNRSGVFRSGVKGTISWPDVSYGVRELTILGGRDHVTLEFEYEHYAREAESVLHPVYLEWMPCNFGGERPWFYCPVCGARSGVLIATRPIFACRKCCGLAYACQGETPVNRACRKLRKIQKRLGNPEWYNCIDWWLPKPKGMHMKTHERLVREGERAALTIERYARWALTDF